MDSDHNFYKSTLLSHLLLEVDEIDSTNKVLESLLEKSSMPSGSILKSAFQSDGKGMANNSWESEKNKNLLFSLLLYPTFLKPHDQFYLSKCLSLAILNALSVIVPSKNCIIKWPNDLYVEGRKISGTLVNSSLKGDKIQYAILGSGINVNQEEFMGNFKATSLKIELGKELKIRDVLESIILQFDELFEKLKKGEREWINDMYLSNLMGYQSWQRYSSKKHGEITGRIVSILEDGRMVLENQNGKSFSFDVKEINLVSK